MDNKDIKKAEKFIFESIIKKAYKPNAYGNSNVLDSIISPDLEYKNTIGDELTSLERQLDQSASANIGKIIDDHYRSFANFTKFDKFNIFRFFYKTNPVLGRCIDLHTDLPLSKLKLTPPKNTESDIVKDFIYYFYNRLLDKLDIFKFLRDFIQSYRIFGEAFALVEDDYASLDGAFDLTSLENLSEIFSKRSLVYSEEDKKFKEDIEKKYEVDPSSVDVQDRIKYLNLIFPFLNKEYKGFDRVSTVPFYKIDEYKKNYSSNYRSITLKIDNNLKSNIGGVNKELAKELGITPAFLNLVSESLEINEGKVEVDNNPYKSSGNSSYVFEIGFDTYSSLINRVIDQSFEWEVLKSAVRTKINMVGKVGRIIVAEGIGAEELQTIKNEIEYMVENPDSEFVTNYKIDIQELNSNIKEDLSQLIGDYERLKEETCMGLGVPLNLLSGDSQFSGDTIKLEIMNNEYLNFKNILSKIVEDYFLKPLAVRKGFFKINEWGDVELIYPTLTFSRSSLRSESQYELLYNMYAKNSVPSSVIYELLNLDPDAVAKSLKNELFSIKNPNFGDNLVSSMMSNVASELGQDPTFVSKVRDELGLPNITTSGEEYSDEDENNDRLSDLTFKSSLGLGSMKRVKNPQKKFERPDLKKNIDTDEAKKNKEPNRMKKLKL